MKRLRRAPGFKRRRVLVIGGHEDGVIAFGKTANEAGFALLRALTAARARLRA